VFFEALPTTSANTTAASRPSAHATAASATPLGSPRGEHVPLNMSLWWKARRTYDFLNAEVKPDMQRSTNEVATTWCVVHYKRYSRDRC
jgi:hypothetical protein